MNYIWREENYPRILNQIIIKTLTCMVSRWNRPITKWQRIFPFLVKKYSTYRGHTKDKIDTLSRYKFNVAYENISDAKGYIADRIFSAFQAKSVPIYWGAPNITEYIDTDTFIDRRQFKSNAELAQFLKQMTEREYNTYIDLIRTIYAKRKICKFPAWKFLQSK